MRRLLLAAMMFGAASGAQAADMPDFLHGSLTPGPSAPTRNWDGWYAGGQIGYSSAEIDFGHATKTLTNFMLRNTVLQEPVEQWALLSKNHAQGTGFGAFVGRNWQWDDLVFGVEANYNYIDSLASSATNSMSRAIVNPAGDTPPAGHTHTYNVTLSGNAALQIKDVMTFRGRAGWAVGDLLPYAFGGLAVGRMDASRSATVSGNLQDDYDVTTTTIVPTTPPTTITTITHHTDFSALPTTSQTEERTNNYVAGWTAGLGMEYMMWGNVFMRGEWEYIKFLSVKDMVVNMNSARFGIGYKF
jgi:outer membrane immunogenic protein